MGTRMCGYVGAVDKEKTSYLYYKRTIDCLSNLHNPDQISTGGGAIFTEKMGPEGQFFH